MNKDALDQAEERLRRAEAATAILEAKGDQDARESAWLDALSALGTVFSKLEQAVKGCTKGAPWFTKKLEERKTDPLLRYLKQARNSAEHGIARGSGYAIKSISFRPTQAGATVGFKQTPNGLEPFSTDPSIKLNVVEDDVSLITVRNRGVQYDPPEDHLGKPLANTGGSAVARAGVEYCRKMLLEAQNL